MFSPASRKSNYSALKDRNVATTKADSSPITPYRDNRKVFDETSILNRPQTGTPAPWASPRLSVLARIPLVKKSENVEGKEQIQPVYVGEFPQVIRDEQISHLRRPVQGHACAAGGMDKKTGLSWMICGSRLFLWSYLSPAASRNCMILALPPGLLQTSDASRNPNLGSSWLLSIINWDNACNSAYSRRQLDSVGIVLCHKKSRAIIYWSDIYKDGGTVPVTSLASSEELEVASVVGQEKSPQSQHHWHNEQGISSTDFNSMIASQVADSQQVIIALASSSNGELWQFHCSPSGIDRKRVDNSIVSSSSLFSDSIQPTGNGGYPRSLVWRSTSFSTEESARQFFLLTNHEIQCFVTQLSSNYNVSKLWSHEIIGTDGDLGIKKDLAGQKRIWPLDVQVDDRGKEITILVATFCKDRVISSSYMQYSLLTMHYKPGLDSLESVGLARDRVLERKAPVQVIIPKARVEEEDFLFSMKLRIGGKPSGSAVILSGDGTATVSYYERNSTRLYQFDLPYDAGKVLDASVFPSSEDGEDGAWAVLTERAGVWAIPEKAVLLGGVEPPERSLSRKGSSKEGSMEEERKNLTKNSSSLLGRANSGARSVGDNEKVAFSGIARQTAHDEEAIGLVDELFRGFLLSGEVDGTLEKLQTSGLFERDGEVNALARMSKSIVDSLAKHWTTTRGAELVALTVISSQLMEKQQKHQKFLQFLALTKCHDELCLKQRHALQIILEHGEKLAAMIQLRELQNTISQRRSTGIDHLYSGSVREASGALWDLIQVVGERARRNTVLLMDRDNAEVFFSKVSELDEVFYCLDRQINCVISEDQPLKVQVPRVCELSEACITLVKSAKSYKNEHHMWYPPPDGLMPWYSQLVVRNGLWSLASLMVQILNEYQIDLAAKSDVCSHLEMLADIMLEASIGAITAKVECGEDHKSLIEEYHHRRDILLDCLYQQIKVFLEAGCKGSMYETEEQKQGAFRNLSSNLLTVARQHQGYQTLWNICHDLNDSALLKSLMSESMGPKGGFSYFVFQQLYENRQISRLLRLGEEFPEELATFLKDHVDIRWLHEIFLHQFSSASATLHYLALSEDGNSSLPVDEGIEPTSAKPELSLAERKRFLFLSKIAAVAGKDAVYETRVERLDADSRIMKSQEEILNLLVEDDKQTIGQKLLPPGDLIRLCLSGGSPELLMKAFDVLAWTSSSFRKGNKSLLEECWRNAIDQDNWDKLFQFSRAEGWSDEDKLRCLEKTILFQASRRCYGPESESFEGGFEEILPLRHENTRLPSPMDSGSSVEAILMQHRDYSDAGKLMLTAVMLGCAGVDIGPEDGFSSME